jgi:hypothetical protein
MDITKLSVVELKALAYDELVKVEQSQKNLVLINQQITKLSQEQPKVEAPKETK